MATIGTFKKTGSNEFTGEIVTLSLQAKNVRIVPPKPTAPAITAPATVFMSVGWIMRSA
jgi:uncharacterized protein (DUF736 family)